MLARDVMTSPVITVGPETEVREIAKRMLEHRISGVPVVDGEGRALGLVSEGDLMRRATSEAGDRPSWWLTLFSGPEEQARRYVKAHGRLARDVMTRPAITVEETVAVAEIAAVLERKRIKRALVVRDGKVVGIVSRSNLVQALASQPAEPPAGTVTDSELRARVHEALRQSGAGTTLLNVLVADGVVHLWGAVRSRAEKEAARVAAEGVSGVVNVEDNVTVLPGVVTSVLGAE